MAETSRGGGRCIDNAELNDYCVRSILVSLKLAMKYILTTSYLQRLFHALELFFTLEVLLPIGCIRCLPILCHYLSNSPFISRIGVPNQALTSHLRCIQRKRSWVVFPVWISIVWHHQPMLSSAFQILILDLAPIVSKA